MSKEYKISYEDYKDLETSTRFVKWMCTSILAVLVVIFIGMATAVFQNHALKLDTASQNNALRLDLALLSKTVLDHLLEQKEKDAHIISFLVDRERDEGEKKRKKDYYARSGDG